MRNSFSAFAKAQNCVKLMKIAHDERTTETRNPIQDVYATHFRGIDFDRILSQQSKLGDTHTGTLCVSVCACYFSVLLFDAGLLYYVLTYRISENKKKTKKYIQKLLQH